MSKFHVHSQVGEYSPYHISAAIPSLTGVGQAVALTQTLGAAITPGTNTVVLSALAGIYPGQLINFAESGGTPVEDIRILSINPGNKSFTAVFQNSYANGASINLTSRNTSYLGGLTINQPGTGVTLTLSNGHPNLTPNPTDPRFGTFAIIKPDAVKHLFFELVCEYGLYVECTGGTTGDYTLLYRDSWG